MKDKNITIQNHLQSHYGIGSTQSWAICNLLGISPLIRRNQLTRYERNKIWNYLKKRNKIIENPQSPKVPQAGWNQEKLIQLPIGDNLKLIQKNHRLHLVKINCYRGFRGKRGLPIRGQRTHTNARTSRRISRILKRI